ncbi:PREDICTED: uncharacterized protein LOC106815162 [Priapulus caudatus]|uniref:Uncharacterized protein LOC106815162 n=1 Tax=Priapulus caudatus TaxID=37621 RepID=A0ABM1ESA8_PRICU|nr:PREDICTED: uncharacterized protein LOC106815162 [Priapulus caudatus]
MHIFLLLTGYDKLKPYGFPVHGAIDGYSRKILWLEVSRSNNNPELIAAMYLDCVQESDGCPILLRTDCGTENGTMASMQAYFRQYQEDRFAGENAHRYGTSPANQRIECWWSFLRRGRSSWWIDLFKSLVLNGEVELGSELQRECLWFCYNRLIQDDLDHVKLHWNTHRIRPSRHGTVPGIPDVLYFLPQQQGVNDCKVHVKKCHMLEMENNLEASSETELSTYQEYFHYIIDNENLPYPKDTGDAYRLFEKLVFIANQ